MAIDFLIGMDVQSRWKCFFCVPFFVLFILILPTSIVYAQVNTVELSEKELSYLKAKKNIRLCFNVNNMPMQGTNSEGVHVGVLADIKGLIAQKIEKQIASVSIGGEKLLSDSLRKDECDFFSTPTRPKKGKQSLVISLPYFLEPIAMLVANEQAAIKNIKYFAGKRFAIKKQTTILKTLQHKYPEIQFIPVHNAKTGLAMVTEGRVFAYVDSLTTLAYQAKKTGVTGLKITNFLDNTFQNFYVIRNDQSILLGILNKAISSITKAEKNAIVNSWGGIKYQKTNDSDVQFYWVITLLLIILVCCWVFIYRIRYQKKFLQASFNTLELEKKQLSADLDEQQQLSKQSIRFAEMFSHEYRTPVSIISTNLDILDLKNHQSSLFIESQIEKMRYAISKLIVLVETALDRESMASTNLIADKSEMDFIQLLDEVKEEIKLNHPKRKLDIQATETPCLLFADKKLLKIMLNNLLENAFKYSHINQPVIVKLATEDAIIAVKVIDKGIGIPYADIEHIFDKFHRASNTSNTVGIGLGLYLSKLIITQHQGSISVICPPEGGTHVNIELPKNGV